MHFAPSSVKCSPTSIHCPSPKTQEVLARCAPSALACVHAGPSNKMQITPLTGGMAPPRSLSERASLRSMCSIRSLRRGPTQPVPQHFTIQASHQWHHLTPSGHTITGNTYLRRRLPLTSPNWHGRTSRQQRCNLDVLVLCLERSLHIVGAPCAELERAHLRLQIRGKILVNSHIEGDSCMAQMLQRAPRRTKRRKYG